MKIVNPATESILREIDEDSLSGVSRKYETARQFLPKWQNTAFEERATIMRRFGELLQTELEASAVTLTQEMGKPITQAKNEIKGVLNRLNFFLEKTPQILKSHTVLQKPSLEEVIIQEPLGVIGNISAWNYPYFVGCNVFIPALLTGNVILYKPSEYATLTGLKISELLQKAGLPKEAFQVIVGTGDTGQYLLKQDLDGIFFTGSYRTGVRVAEAAAPKLMKMQLELGGKDPVYVCEDTPLEKTVTATADGAFYNTGQSCCSVERIYVHQDVHEAFLRKFVEEVSRFSVGDPLQPDTYIGPLTRPQQLDLLEQQVQDAVAKGAKLLMGGRRRKGVGYFFEPTVLSDVTHEMDVMREESFGPIIGIQKVKDDREAVEKMNESQYGLTASVYTANRERALSILKQSQAGTGYWNCCDRVSPYLPWTGWKHSGIGVTLSEYGISTFLRPKALHLIG